MPNVFLFILIELSLGMHHAWNLILPLAQIFKKKKSSKDKIHCLNFESVERFFLVVVDEVMMKKMKQWSGCLVKMSENHR